jgi:hypothetical protein
MVLAMSDAPSSERVPTVDEVRIDIERMVGRRREHIAERELAMMLRAIPESDAST